ncbi:MAG: hypothetical protein ABIF40_05115 [archaeon]
MSINLVQDEYSSLLKERIKLEREHIGWNGTAIISVLGTAALYGGNLVLGSVATPLACYVIYSGINNIYQRRKLTAQISELEEKLGYTFEHQSARINS